VTAFLVQEWCSLLDENDSLLNTPCVLSLFNYTFPSFFKNTINDSWLIEDKIFAHFF